MKEVVSIKAINLYLSGCYKKTPSFMAKITLFAQVIQNLPKELIKSLAKKHGTDSLPRDSIHGATW